MFLRVNLIAKRHFWNAGEEVPDSVVPDWCRLKHRIGPVEAAQIRQRTEELREEACARREKAEAKKAMGRKGAKQSGLKA
jgi:hypothetical protein